MGYNGLDGMRLVDAQLPDVVLLDVEMPITSAVVRVLHEGLPIEQLAALLLARPHKAEGV